MPSLQAITEAAVWSWRWPRTSEGPHGEKRGLPSWCPGLSGCASFHHGPQNALVSLASR